MTILYLIRHAEAEGNVFRRLQAQYDAMITPNGMKQIAALQKRFPEPWASKLSRPESGVKVRNFPEVHSSHGIQEDDS